MNENVKYKIYTLKEYILVYNIDKQRYTFYAKGEEPFRQIDSDGRSTSDYKVSGKFDTYYSVRCPYLCHDFNILVSKDDIKEVDLNNPKILYKFLNFLGEFHPKTIKIIKEVIDNCLFTGKYE